LPPPTNQILCDKPKELYLIDITEIPTEFLNDDKDKLYLLSIIDHFSKFACNYIIKNKEKKTVLNNIKKFINKYGVPDKILTDKGGNFEIMNLKNIVKKIIFNYYMGDHRILKPKVP
jgi:hypothetical protein